MERESAVETSVPYPAEGCRERYRDVMGGPLDDALDSYDRSASFRTDFEQQRRAERDARQERFRKLALEFVARMNRVGNPDTHLWFGGEEPLVVWSFTACDDSDSLPRHHVFTIDGCVPVIHQVSVRRSFRRPRTVARAELVPISKAPMMIGADGLETVAAAMAHQIRKHDA